MFDFNNKKIEAIISDMNYPYKKNKELEIKKITFAHLFKDVFEAFELERGIIYTTKGLLFSPGKTVKQYLGEKRYDITNPFRLLLLTTTISYIILNFTGFAELLEPVVIDVNRGTDDEFYSNVDLSKAFLEWFNLVLWIAVPIYAITSYFLNRKKGYNLAEYIVIFSFFISSINLIFIFSSPLILLLGQDVFSIIMSLLSLIIYMVYLIRLLEYKGLRSLGLIMLNLILSNIFYFLIIIGLIIMMLGLQMYQGE